jgi:23S rRNA pseudouridine1911/1915/1917 synthase
MASFTTTAAPEARGQRLDRFLADAIGTLSRSRVKTLIEQGQARRDGEVLSEPSEPVRPGAIYELALPPPAPASPVPQAIPFPILYEDADLIVLDKPAGLVVHPAPGTARGTPWLRSSAHRYAAQLQQPTSARYGGNPSLTGP